MADSIGLSKQREFILPNKLSFESSWQQLIHPIFKIPVYFSINLSDYLLLITISLSACNQTHDPSQIVHDTHLKTVNEQGNKTMGFSHEKTTHHFRLFAGGGAIEVTANSAQDTESRDRIRKHLGHIAKMFSEGNFDAPMLTHGKIPPGVPVLQKSKAGVSYIFEEIENGARVRIKTSNPEALAAAHELLRFQISDHQTNDSTEITTE